ncbi:MAG TPA: hypothetical protein VKU41_21085 [Polyangiaceae bacterium]|nr:hypothetical protein [Polyangiaceae bacterium]
MTRRRSPRRARAIAVKAALCLLCLASVAPRASADETASPDASAPDVPANPAPSAAPAPREPSFTPTAAGAFTPPTNHPVDARDAHADRVVALPTAFVHPAGTVYASDYDILLLQAGYAVSDSVQISLTASPPLEGSIVPLDLSVKGVIARDGPVQVAAMGSVSGVLGVNQGYSLVGRVGAVAQFCFDDACASSASLAADAALAGGVTLAVTGAGAIWRIASGLSLLLEVDTLLPLARDAGPYNSIAVFSGIRLPHRNWALDLTLGRATGTPYLLPLAVFSVRFLP